ncbi:hypothetical protein [Arthrobacter sp. B0490]|uniref:hypothetical protein n=1 Tax=Arthrobacter sp. B0490 TaxID=2058891 RepID=UPI000CE3D6ED|nr:hypothetical protein [Arthrobacter sp. B0490]
MAISWTVDIILEPGLMEHCLDQGEGMSLILDIPAVEQAIDSPVPSHTIAYSSDRGIFVPRDVTPTIARVLAARNADRINWLVEQQQAERREIELRNTVLRGRTPKHRQDVADEEDLLLSWRYLREWSAASPQEVRESPDPG